ncbi:MAG: ROK family protein [Clostridiales bacterium]|jgi:glucokinase|nr:ROK family protein [Clostridiales bacterium]
MYIIGIDIGGMSVKGGVVDQSGTIIYKASVETKANSDDYRVIISDIAFLINKLLQHTNLKITDVKGLGMGIPGTIDSVKGVIVYSNNINFINVPIVAEINKHFNGLPVFINNDANAAALGEHRFGSAKDVQNIVFVTLGTGVGTGIIIEGKLFEGKASAGAEGGHTVICVDGEPCSCGRRGCFEAYASAVALVRQTKAAIAENPFTLMKTIAEEKGKISGRTAFIAAAHGDKAGIQVVDNYVKYVGEGIVNLANIFRPDVVLIGGGVSNEGDALINPLQKYMDGHCYGMQNGNPRVLVKKASLTNDAGILGAASLVL